MTVQNQNVKNVYRGNGSTTVFPFTFAINESHPEYIHVYITNDGGKAVETTDFTCDMETRTITYPKVSSSSPKLSATQRLTIYRLLPYEQNLNLVNQGPFFSEDVETQLDDLEMQIQQLNEESGRRLQVGLEVDGFDTTVPIEAGKTFRVKDDGTGFELTEDPKAAREAAEAAQAAAEHAQGIAEDARDDAEAAAALTELQAVWFDNVAALRAADIPVGMTAGTKGYYAVNDGKGAEYLIREREVSDLDDGIFVIFLSNGNVAELINKKRLHHCYFMPTDMSETGLTASGTCSVIVTRFGKVIMLDSGTTGAYPYIKQVLDNVGVTKVDYFILSHFHGDHFYNLQRMVIDYDFSDAVFYLPKHTSKFDGIVIEENKCLSWIPNSNIIRPDSGDTLKVEDITFTFFNCDQSDIEFYDLNTDDYNNYSMCCYAECGGKNILFTGDIQPLAEERLYNQGHFKKTNVLNIPHHSYNVGVFDPYMITVNPELAVASISPGGWVGNTGSNRFPEVDFYSSISKLYCLYNGMLELVFNKECMQYKTKGILHFAKARNKNITLFVDLNYVGVSNGTELKPFKTVTEAVAIATKLYKDFKVIISPKPGTTYVNESETVFITNAKNQITLKSLSLNSLVIETCNSIILDDIEITGTSNNALTCGQSKVEAKSLTINGVCKDEANPYLGRGMSIYNTSFYCQNLTISNKSIAIFVDYCSEAFILSLAGTNVTYAMYTGASNTKVRSYTMSSTHRLFMSGQAGYAMNADNNTFQLQGNEDLNNLKEIATYNVPNGQIANTLLNKPSAATRASAIIVKPLIPGYYQDISQTWINKDLQNEAWSGIWRRHCLQDVWTPWTKINTTF